MVHPIEEIYRAAGPILVGTGEGAILGAVGGRTEVGAVAGFITALLIHVGARLAKGEEPQISAPSFKPREYSRGSAVVGPRAPTYRHGPNSRSRGN